MQYQRDISISCLWLDEVCKLIKINNRDKNLFNRGILKNKNEEEIINKLRSYYID
jgi:predicted PolB exonuclease-like 3'-5' exonuclease